eukprot:2018969-Rhodomonas_salina.3
MSVLRAEVHSSRIASACHAAHSHSVQCSGLAASASLDEQAKRAQLLTEFVGKSGERAWVEGKEASGESERARSKTACQDTDWGMGMGSALRGAGGLGRPVGGG